LKGLETKPDYPKEKPWYFRPGKDTHVDYNILSNVNMQEHHYAQPDKRPELEAEKVSYLLIMRYIYIYNS
jgi:hypothetical protein